MMRLCAFLAFFLTAALHGQYPPGTQWRRIQTAHYELVFPREIEADAQRAANMLETLYGPIAESLGGVQARRTTIRPAGIQQARHSQHRAEAGFHRVCSAGLPSRWQRRRHAVPPAGGDFDGLNVIDAVGGRLAPGDHPRIPVHGCRTGLHLNLLHFPENIKAGLRYAYRLDYHNARLQPFLAFTF
jgi:hypothetical protein